MSTTISYRHCAIRFSISEIEGIFDDVNLYRDRYILLELHGSSNTTTYHPQTGREVGARHWSVQAIGDAVDIVRTAILSSAFCEGQCLRCYGQSITTPEQYIRRVRSALRNHLTLGQAMNNGFTIEVNLRGEQITNLSEVERLNNQIVATETTIGYQWQLRPLLSVKDAALLFSLNSLDTRSPFEFMNVYGREFGL